MALVKVRRDGNSLAVTIPAKEARIAHLAVGAYVNVEVVAETGDIRIEAISVSTRMRPEVISAGRQVMARNRQLYQRLARAGDESD